MLSDDWEEWVVDGVVVVVVVVVVTIFKIGDFSKKS